VGKTKGLQLGVRKESGCGGKRGAQLNEEKSRLCGKKNIGEVVSSSRRREAGKFRKYI